nr:zinc-ribbon domain-containing protein [uncultured Sphingomonas sp.]
MILTCPACDTKYVVKDGAIPPGGRKVRCASCKHSWHQDPDPIAAEVAEEQLPNPLGTITGPPEPAPDAPTPFGEPGGHEIADQFIAEVPEPDIAQTAWNDGIEQSGVAEPTIESADAMVASESYAVTESNSTGADIGDDRVLASGDVPLAPEAIVAADDRRTDVQFDPVDDERVGYIAADEDGERRRSKWPWIIGLIALLAVAAAAFWYLAPQDWKSRAGIAQAGESPLQLVITSKPDRQMLSSGNELVSISGKVTNPTDKNVDVPPIQATLRNSSTKQIVHRWTIAPPAKVLSPGSSASFNSAEVDIPTGGDELTISWAG